MSGPPSRRWLFPVGGMAALAGVAALLLLAAGGGAPRRGDHIGALGAGVSGGSGSAPGEDGMRSKKPVNVVTDIPLALGPDEARSKAVFPLLLPGGGPAGAARGELEFVRGFEQPTDDPGEQYCFFYRSEEATIEVIAGEGPQPLDIAGMTETRIAPDTRYRDKTVPAFRRTQVRGVQAVCRDPSVQIIMNGRGTYQNPGEVAWQVPSRRPGFYLTYALISYELTAEQLIRIAETLR